MNRTINGIGSPVGSQGAGPSSLEQPSTSTSASASVHSVSDDAQSHRRSLKNRLLACLGMTSPTGTGSGTASPAARNFALPMRRSNRDAEVFAESIRTRCRGLPPSVAQRFEHQLSNILQRKASKGRLDLLRMLEKNVINAEQGSSSRASSTAAPVDTARTSPPAPTPRQKTKLVVVRFKDVEARLPEEQEQQIQAIRLSILKLPGAKAADYQMMLSRVISTDNAAFRGQLLRQMSEQIAEHLAP